MGLHCKSSDTSYTVNLEIFLPDRSPARPWYPGRTPPSEEVLSIFDEAGEPEVLYNQANPEDIEGEFASLMRSVYSKMDILKRSPDDFRTKERGGRLRHILRGAP